jgi:hypothetical protein
MSTNKMIGILVACFIGLVLGRIFFEGMTLSQAILFAFVSFAAAATGGLIVSVITRHWRE